MAGQGSIYVTGSPRAVGNNQYDVDVRFDIAFNYGGYNRVGAYYEIWCDGQKASGSATFEIPSGGGSWVWGNIGGTKTFRVTMPTSGAAKNIGLSASISTGISPATISASATHTLAARTWLWTVNYNANGGSGAPGSQTKTQGVNLTLSSVKPTRTGYTFKGWATSASGAVVYQPGGTYTANAGVTLYAVWQIITYSIAYNANGGSGAPGTQTKNHGTNLVLSSTKPTRTNYNFKGWGTSASSTTVAYAAGATYTANASVTLYAIWELAYAYPRITNIKVDRCNSAGTATETGTYAKLTFNWATDRSISKCTVEFKQSTTSTWGSAVAITASGTSGSASKVIGGSFNTEYAYDVRITVGDSGGNTVVQSSVAPIAYTIDFLAGGKGVAFGKPAATANTVESAWPIKTDSNMDVVGNLTTNGWGYFKNHAYDAFNKRINNGLCVYTSAGIDPNTTLDELILTHHANGPVSGQYYYIRTMFYSTKSTTANVAQYALPYAANGSMYHRYHYNGTWTAWRRHANADEFSSYVTKTKVPVEVRTGTIVKKLDANLNAVVIHSMSQIAALFGRSSISIENLSACYINGDGGACSLHIHGTTYLDSNLYALTSSTTSVDTDIRINYAYFLIP